MASIYEEKLRAEYLEAETKAIAAKDATEKEYWRHECDKLYKRIKTFR